MQGKNKTSEILRAQKKYSKNEANVQRTYIVLAQNFWPQKRYSWQETTT